MSKHANRQEWARTKAQRIDIQWNSDDTIISSSKNLHREGADLVDRRAQYRIIHCQQFIV